MRAGLELVASGLTTLDELLRTVGEIAPRVSKPQERQNLNKNTETESFTGRR